MNHPTRPTEVHISGLVGLGRIRFLAVIPHGRGTREIAVDVEPALIPRIADALRATRGTACDSLTSRHVDGTEEGYHVGHAIWHVEHPDAVMPCLDHSRTIETVTRRLIDQPLEATGTPPPMGPTSAPKGGDAAEDPKRLDMTGPTGPAAHPEAKK